MNPRQLLFFFSFGQWEEARYVSYSSSKRRTDVVCLHRPFRPILRSFNHRTGPTLLAPALDVLPATDEVESLPNFEKRLVDSKMSTRTPIVHLSKYSLDSGDLNHQLPDMLSTRTF